MAKIITLTDGKETLVDDEDFEFLNHWKWRNSNGYAKRGSLKNGHFHTVNMHRVIMHTPDGMETDHINGNRLDNRKENLRICSHSENAYNAPKKISNTSGYKGVYWDKFNNKWRASITVSNKTVRLGRFINIIDAVNSYDSAARRYFGEFARTNFNE